MFYCGPCHCNTKNVELEEKGCPSPAHHGGLRESCAHGGLSTVGHSTSTPSLPDAVSYPETQSLLLLFQGTVEPGVYTGVLLTKLLGYEGEGNGLAVWASVAGKLGGHQR